MHTCYSGPLTLFGRPCIEILAVRHLGPIRVADLLLRPFRSIYSNRSACYCGLRKYDEALEDVRAGRTSPARSTANAAHPHPRLTHLTLPTHTPAACADAHQLRLHACMLLRACVRLRAWPRLRACACACTPALTCSCVHLAGDQVHRLSLIHI